MHKDRSAIVLVALLLLLISGWWAVSATHLIAPVGAPTQQAATTESTPPVDANYTLPPTVAITASVAAGTHTYQGSLVIPYCDQLSTSISTAGADVSLALAVLKPNAVCNATGNTTVPFEITYTNSAVKAPTLAHFTINNTEVPFTVATH